MTGSLHNFELMLQHMCVRACVRAWLSLDVSSYVAALARHDESKSHGTTQSYSFYFKTGCESVIMPLNYIKNIAGIVFVRCKYYVEQEVLELCLRRSERSWLSCVSRQMCSQAGKLTIGISPNHCKTLQHPLIKEEEK